MNRLPKSVAAKEVWIYILGYYGDYDYMPTLDEIAKNFSTDGKAFSKEWARLCLKELEKQKKIKVEPRKHRGITLIQ